MHDGLLIGRTEELETVAAFLVRPSDALPAALVLEGEAGIGKTVLWREAVARARADEATVLSSALALGEAQLAFACLADLVEEVWDGVADHLADPQRTALEHALLLREATHSPPDERAVAFGFLGLVRALAQTRPLTIAIDDVQWLDPSSAAMLRYTIRRLRHEPVRLLLARRPEEDAGPDPWLLARADGIAVETVAVGPLTLGALHRLLRGRLGHALTRPALTRIHAASRGNPLHALELARSIESPLGAAAGSLPALMRSRVTALATETRSVLLLAALTAEPSLATLSQAGVRAPTDALATAIEAELVTMDGATIRFRHPLIAAAVVETCDADEHRTAHRLLAEAAGTDEERARHLGRAAIRPDAAIAARLEHAAGLAQRRGARAVSAELFEEAAAATPVVDISRRGQRLIEAGHAFFDAGDVDRARELLDSLVATLPDGRERVEAGWHLGRVLNETGDSVQATRIWHEALATTDDPRLTSELERAIAYATVYIGSIPDAARHAAASVAAAESAGDSSTLAYALAAQSLIGVLSGSPDYVQTLERALALDRESDGQLGEWSPVAVSAECGRLAGEVDRTREAYETVLTRAIATGDVSTELWATYGLMSTELLAGRLDRARELADPMRDLADQTGLMRVPAAALVANVAAHAGELERAHTLVSEALAEARATDEHMYQLTLLNCLGFIESSQGSAVAAAASYRLARSIAAELGARHLTVLRSALHEAEAATTAGLHDQASEAVARYDEWTPAFAPPWLESVRLRACAAIALAAGDTAQERAMLETAASTADETVPFEAARTRLAYGSFLRRAREYTAARVELRAALDTFETMGAVRWAQTASDEYARIPGRTRRAEGALTDAEQRIAELVARGRSNKEVAAALFITVNTVEAALTRVYRKLGIRSRTELAARFAADAKEAT